MSLKVEPRLLWSHRGKIGIWDAQKRAIFANWWVVPGLLTTLSFNRIHVFPKLKCESENDSLAEALQQSSKQEPGYTRRKPIIMVYFKDFVAALCSQTRAAPSCVAAFQRSIQLFELPQHSSLVSGTKGSHFYPRKTMPMIRFKDIEYSNYSNRTARITAWWHLNITQVRGFGTFTCLTCCSDSMRGGPAWRWKSWLASERPERLGVVARTLIFSETLIRKARTKAEVFYTFIFSKQGVQIHSLKQTFVRRRKVRDLFFSPFASLSGLNDSAPKWILKRLCL